MNFLFFRTATLDVGKHAGNGPNNFPNVPPLGPLRYLPTAPSLGRAYDALFDMNSVRAQHYTTTSTYFVMACVKK